MKIQHNLKDKTKQKQFKLSNTVSQSMPLIFLDYFFLGEALILLEALPIIWQKW